MSEDVFDAGFVSMTILKLYGQVAKITGLTTPPPNLRLIGIAIVLARALESISTLILGGKTSMSSHQDDDFPEKSVRAATFAAAVREELVDAIAELEGDDDPATGLDLPFVAVLMERAISTIDLLVGDRAVIESNIEDDAERAAQILLLTTEVFGGAENAVTWLCAPTIPFDGLRPLDLLTSRHGAKMVAIHLMTRAKPSWEGANA
jgi:hypothetical protein